jgi:AcrR family transcriptional regulator
MAREKRTPVTTVRNQVGGREGRAETEAAFLDAAERLLIEVGYAQISTRRLAEEAGANAGLVHYYFGSMEEVFVRALERFTERLITRQRAMYAAEKPFIEKWRTAMGYLDEDLAAGYPKIWLELQALGWNRPDLRERVAHVNAEWRAVLRSAFAQAHEEYGLDEADFPLEALVSLVMTFNVGIEVERLSGISDGHRELLGWVDAWLQRLEDARQDKDVRRPAT